jgi:hypothetical protein
MHSIFQRFWRLINHLISDNQLIGTYEGGCHAERDNIQQATKADWLLMARDYICAELYRTRPPSSVPVFCVGGWFAERDRAYSKRLKLIGWRGHVTVDAQNRQNSATFKCAINFSAYLCSNLRHLCCWISEVVLFRNERNLISVTYLPILHNTTWLFLVEKPGVLSNNALQITSFSGDCFKPLFLMYLAATLEIIYELVWKLVRSEYHWRRIHRQKFNTLLLLVETAAVFYNSNACH